MAAIYPADTFQEGVDLTIEASNQLAQVVRGDANTEVMVADGSTIPSIRKAQADSMYFKEPELWTTGQTETDYLQLKKYIDPTTGKESWWFAKSATVLSPVAMGTSPFGDDNWTLYTPEDLFISGKAEYESIYQALKGKAAEAGYNLVRGSFEEGGTLTNINDVLWYQATGKYYSWYNGSAKTVVAGSTPSSTGGISSTAWVDRTDLTLRGEINFILRRYSSVDELSSDANLDSSYIGKVVSTGFTQWKIQGSAPLTAGYISLQNSLAAIPVSDIHVDDFGAEDDGDLIQDALDIQYLSGMRVEFGAKQYNTTKPLVMWATSTDDNSVELFGKGITNTIINKTTNTKLTDLVDHTTIDAVLFIANEYAKAGTSVTDVTTTQTATRFPIVRDMQLTHSSSTAVTVGIYSLGVFHGQFSNIWFKDTEYAMVIKYWNCFCTYKRLELDTNKYGCDFSQTIFGSNSTMHFEDCHANGIDICAYKILGRAVMINCSFDGGAGTHVWCPGYDRGAAGYLSGDVTMINCHHESPAIATGNRMFLASYASNIRIYSGEIEIPYISWTATDYLCEASYFSSFTLDKNTKMTKRYGATKCLGGLRVIDTTSQFKSDALIDSELFGVAVRVNYNKSDYHRVTDRFSYNLSNIAKFIYYVSSAVPVEERSVTTLSYADNRIQVDIANAYARVMTSGVQFNELLDLTDYSRILIKGTTSFVEGSGTGEANMQLGLNTSLITDGSVGNGAAIALDYLVSVSGKQPSNYTSTDFERYIDITQITGSYYLSVIYYGININADIQSIYLIR